MYFFYAALRHVRAHFPAVQWAISASIIRDNDKLSRCLSRVRFVDSDLSPLLSAAETAARDIADK